MDEQKDQIVDKLKGATNILVTVSANPSVDQLAACIGLTILLNKMKKHATAVFSGQVPDSLEFLQPEETLENNTNSLRDFIISLDKSKADKLRYKVEENVVKIFITPYRTSITQDDLDFSEGDFNVDAVLALGVQNQDDMDKAITAHGHIFHDAAIISVNTQPGADLGGINWTDPGASSLSELALQLTNAIDRNLLDGQIATAYLTGIVAETERFSNEKTSPETMKLSAELLTAGANQQLVADELEKDDSEGGGQTGGGSEAEPVPGDGTLEIKHPNAENDEEHHEIDHQDQSAEAAPDSEAQPEKLPDVHDVKQNTFGVDGTPEVEETHSQLPPPHYLTEPPRVGGSFPMGGSEWQEDSYGALDPMMGGRENIPLLNRDGDDHGKSEPPKQEESKAPELPALPELPPLDTVPNAPKPAHEQHDEPDIDQKPVWQPAPVKHAESAADTEVKAAAPDTKPQSPTEQASSFQALPSEPAPAKPEANNQIHIDANGTIRSAATPVSAPPTPEAAPIAPAAPKAEAPAPAPVSATSQLPPPPIPAKPNETLEDIEKAVHSPHTDSPAASVVSPLPEPAPVADVQAARDAVMSAIDGAPQPSEALESVVAGKASEAPAPKLIIPDRPIAKPVEDTTPAADPAAAVTYAPYMSPAVIPSAYGETPSGASAPGVSLPPASAVPPTTPAVSQVPPQGAPPLTTPL